MNVPKLRFKEFDGEWEADFLEKAIDVKSGKDYKHLDKGNVPVYGTGGYMLSVNDYLSDKDAIGIGRKGSIDKPQKLIAPFWTVDTLFYCLPKEHNNLSFLFTLFQKVPWKKFDESTGVPSLSKTTIEKIKINLPNKDEQKKIGDFFELINKKIQLQQQKIDLLQEQKKGYMQKVFDNNKSDTSGEKWERINLNEIFLIIDGDRGKNYPSEEEFLEHGHTLFLDTKNVTKKGFKFNTKKFISEEKCKKMNNGLLMRNDLVLTSRGTIGNLALYDDSVPFNSVRINSAMLILRLVKPDISLMFLYHLLKSKVLIDFIRSSSVGSAQPHITKKDLKSLKVTFPSSLVSQEKIARFLSLIDESVKFEEEKLGLLLKQKQGFMQQMFI